MHGPLQGVRILDLTHVWAGPLAVRFLADLGAEVVKIEAPFGRGPQSYPSEPLGGWLGGSPGDKPWNNNAMFCKLHRNRKSVCLDLKRDEGRLLCLELVRRADVLVENFSAAAMAGMGLDADTLADVNANLIYVTMPGFGCTGPYAERVAFGPVVEAMSGLSTVLGYGPEAPHNSALALMDPVAATHAAAAVSEALRTRQAGGGGVRIELSLHEGGVTYCGPWLLDTQMGQPPKSMGNRHPNLSPQGVYRCLGEDQWVAVTCADDQQWQGECNLVAVGNGPSYGGGM